MLVGLSHDRQAKRPMYALRRQLHSEARAHLGRVCVALGSGNRLCQGVLRGADVTLCYVCNGASAPKRAVPFRRAWLRQALGKRVPCACAALQPCGGIKLMQKFAFVQSSLEVTDIGSA